MLVLTRKKNEVIYIGEGENQIKITIVDAQAGKTRLGIDAPRHIKVYRKEVLDRINEEKKQ